MSDYIYNHDFSFRIPSDFKTRYNELIAKEKPVYVNVQNVYNLPIPYVIVETMDGDFLWSDDIQFVGWVNDYISQLALNLSSIQLPARIAFTRKSGLLQLTIVPDGYATSSDFIAKSKVKEGQTKKQSDLTVTVSNDLDDHTEPLVYGEPTISDLDTVGFTITLGDYF